MRAKLLSGVAAVSLTACTVLAATGPASARTWHHAWRHGYGWGGPIAAGVVIGGIPAATSPDWAPNYYDYVPGASYGYGPLPFVQQGGNVAQGGAIAFCQQRFRSYDPSTGTYLGANGRRHACP